MPPRIRLHLSSSDNRYHHFALLVDGEVVGSCRITTGLGPMRIKSEKTTLYSVEIHRGQRDKGYGTELIRRLLKRARKFGFGSVCLYVRKRNRFAVRLYKKFGFTKSFDWSNGEMQMTVNLTVREKVGER